MTKLRVTFMANWKSSPPRGTITDIFCLKSVTEAI